MSIHSSQHANASYGQRVMKTKVKVCGRFLLKPNEEFNAMVARQLVDKAKVRNTKVTTELKAFENGIQLGEHGLFAAMPLEFIKYNRLDNIIELTNEPNILTICVKDYEQRCVTVMRLKDAVSVKVAMDVLWKRRSAYLEDFAKSSEFGSTLHRPVASMNGDRQWNGFSSGGGVRDHTDGSAHQRQRPMASVETKEASILLTRDSDNGMVIKQTDDPDYAVIRKRQTGWPRQPQPVYQQHQQQQSMSSRQNTSGSGFFTQITVPAGPTYYENQRPQRDEADEQRQQRHQQYQQRRSQMLAKNSADDELDDLEMAAVFETLDGPPTVLNEPIRYVARVTDTARMDSDDVAGRRTGTANWRLADQGHYYKGRQSTSSGRLIRTSLHAQAQ